MNNIKVVEGSEAVALAVKACRPQVISAYPISPQTHIVERLAKMIADGELETEYVRVESEFSAASVISGASAAASRSYTASSSQGLLLMTEVLYASAGLRLPFVITGVNRAVSAPISIQVDHQDATGLRDSGVIQFYVESSQEAYDTHIAAFKVKEERRILLPVMVCMEGWILTHSYERVSFMEQEEVDRFLPPFQPVNFLDVNDPKARGSYAEDDVFYICVDNGAYMNTGGQRSGATPMFAATTTHPPGKESLGKTQMMKDLPAIVAAHGTPYVATASVAYLKDLQKKVKRAMKFHGSRYLQIDTPCPSGWGFPPDRTLEVGRMGIDCGLIPIFAMEDGKITTRRKIKKQIPVTDYLKAQARFRHLFTDNRGQAELDEIQAMADQNIEKYGLLKVAAPVSEVIK